MFHDTWLCINLWLCCTCKQGCRLKLANIRGRYFVLVYVSQLWIVETDRRLLISSNSFMHTSRNLYEALQLDKLITLESIGWIPSGDAIFILAQISNHFKFQSSAANVSRFTWFWVHEMAKKGWQKKRISVPSMVCVHCSYFNEKPQTQKSYKKPQKKVTKKKITSTDRVFC